MEEQSSVDEHLFYDFTPRKPFCREASRKLNAGDTGVCTF